MRGICLRDRELLEFMQEIARISRKDVPRSKDINEFTHKNNLQWLEIASRSPTSKLQTLL